MRNHYAHVVDPLRKFNPQLTMQNVRDNGYVGSDDDEELVLSAIEEAEDEFDAMTRNPFREVRVGTPGRPRSYETHEAEMYRTEYGTKVWLDNMDVTPIDPAEGDVIEVRTGKDSWDDITNSEGDRWEMDYSKGWVRVFTRYRRSVYRPQLRDRFLRLTYRHGAPGGTRRKAAQTELSADAAKGDTTLDVADAGALPRSGVLLAGGDEYVTMTGRDIDAGTITVSRAARRTSASAHGSGTTVHYCPLELRQAVAARVAQELLRYEDWVDDLVESGGYDAQSRMEDWKAEWQQALDKYASVRSV